MKKTKIAFIGFYLFLVIFFIMYKMGEKDKIIEDKLLRNNVELKGIIKSFKISNNHCFAIIYLENIECNISSFNPETKRRFFPYAINKKQSEIYTHICELESKEIGDTLELISNDFKIKMYNKVNKERIEKELYMIT